MTVYNTLNRNSTEVTLHLSSNMVGSSNDETNFPNRLLLTNTQVSGPRETFANCSSANTNIKI